MGRTVLAIEFASTETPAGNRLLIEKGAKPIHTRQELGRILADLDGESLSAQLRLI